MIEKPHSILTFNENDNYLIIYSYIQLLTQNLISWKKWLMLKITIQMQLLPWNLHGLHDDFKVSFKEDEAVAHMKYFQMATAHLMKRAALELGGLHAGALLSPDIFILQIL